MEGPKTAVFFASIANFRGHPSEHGGFSSLPEWMKNQVLSYRRIEDAQSCFLGKMVLKRALEAFGVTTSLHSLILCRGGKLQMADISVVFNLSHSGEGIACAMSNEVQAIGVDMEKIAVINPHEFVAFWTPREMDLILGGNLDTFYKCWTRKEAVLKANGVGLVGDLRAVEILSDEVFFDNITYFVRCVPFRKEYMVHVATTSQVESIQTIYIDDWESKYVNVDSGVSYQQSSKTY